MVEAELTSVLNGADAFLSRHNMELVDQSVSEIFGIMLGLTVAPVELQPSNVTGRQPERTAIVGFSGILRGSCGIRFSSQAAHAVASAMSGGMPVEEDSESIDDAVGELCNMLAGGWKGRVRELESECLLSPPAVISGTDYHIHVRKASLTLTRNYRFQGHTFQVIMVHDRPPAVEGSQG